MDDQHTLYELIEGIFTIEAHEHIGYGISVKCVNSLKPLFFHDISTNKEDIVNLISLCNKLQLDPIHIRDVIDDFLLSR